MHIPPPASFSRPKLGRALALLAAAGLSCAAHAAETPSLVVTTTADVVNSEDNLTSLREAVNHARNLSFGVTHTITFDPSVAGQTFYLATVGGLGWGPTALYTTNAVTIDGGSLGVTIARDPAVSNLRLFEVASNNSTLTFKAVTLKSGRAMGFGAHEGGGSAGFGGAIVNMGTIILNGVTFVDNEAVGGTFSGTGIGGGSGLNAPGTQFNGGGNNAGFGAEGTAGDGSFRGGGGYGYGPAGVGGRGAFGGGGGLGDFQGGTGGFGGGGGGSSTDETRGAAGGFGAGKGGLSLGGAGAGLGGAIFNAGGTIRGSNVTFTRNSAIGGVANPARATAANNGSGYGGAIFNYNGSVTLTHATVANNVAAQGGGGIYHLSDNGARINFFGVPENTLAAPAKVHLINTLLSGSHNGASALVSDFVQNTNDTGNTGNPGYVASLGVGNLIQTRAAAANDFGGAALTADPLLGPLANYGGPTQVIRLNPGSPAINAGVLSHILVDQLGQSRPMGPSGAPGLVGYYYTLAVPPQQTLLNPLDNLKTLVPTVTQITSIVDFGLGTETVAGDGTVLDRGESNGNRFGGIGVNVGLNSVAAYWFGAVTVPQTATYRFTTRSDDGTVLFIDGQLVVNNNFSQAMTNRSGDIVLAAGPHVIEVGYYQGGGGSGVQVSWEQLDGASPFPRQIIPASALSRTFHSGGVGDFADIGAFEAADISPPAGGSFAVLPGATVRLGDPLATVFAGWTDANPIEYEVSVGANVLFPLGNSPVQFFTLPAGIHQISGRVVDTAGLETSVGPITVLVDGQAPQLTVPGDISVVAHTEAEAVVHFTVTATDDNDAHPVVTVSTPSGSVFPDGTTTVTVTATDDAGNVAQASFDVTVTYDFVAYRRLLTLDGLVPGAGEPGSGIEDEMLFGSFGPPAINSTGDVAMLARIRRGQIKYPVIILKRGSNGPSALPAGRQLARVGSEVPGISNVVWATLKDPQVAEDGSVLVQGTIKGTSPAAAVPAPEKTVLVWYPADGGSPQLVARTGQVASADGATLKTILGTGVVSNGVVALSGALTLGSGTPAVAGTTDRVVLTWDSASGELVPRVREGFSPGGTLPAVKIFKTLVAGSGAPGMGRGWLVSGETTPGNPAVARLRVQATFTDATSAELSIDLTTGVPSVLFGTGVTLGTEVSGGASGVQLKAIGLAAAGNDDDTAVVRATPTSGALGLFARAGNQAASLVRAGEVAPQSGGALFKSFGDPIVSADGSGYAFVGRLSGTGVLPQNDTALFWGDAGGHPGVLIAREGSTAPETGGGVFLTFNSLAAPGGGQGPLVLAKLKPGTGGATTANDMGLWAMDSQGTLRLLLREGVTTIGSKTVKSFITLSASSGNPGITRNFNAAGEILAVVTFTDTTTAVVQMTMPPPAR